MNDPRYERLADILTRHSTRLEPGENLLVETWDIPEEMVIALLESARGTGAHVHVLTNTAELTVQVNGSPSNVQAMPSRHHPNTTWKL